MRAVLLLVLLAGCPSDWRNRDTAAEVAAIAVTSMDWYQTRGIVKVCNEENPIIGPCGERVDVDGYFTATILVETLVERLLSSDTRPLFQGVWIGVEGETVYRNRADGF